MHLILSKRRIAVIYGGLLALSYCFMNPILVELVIPKLIKAVGP